MARPLVLGGRFVTDVATVVAEYRPRLPDDVWAAIAPLVRNAVTRAGPSTVWTAHAWMKTATRFVAWAVVEEYVALDVERLFHPDLVERYAAVGRAGMSQASTGTHRAALTTIGRRVTRRAPWPPEKQALPRHYLSDPYSTDEVDRFWEAATQQSTRLRERVATALLAAGLGAGLRPGEHLTVTGGMVRVHGGVVVVHVPRPGRDPRLVPVLGRYAEAIENLACLYPDEPLIGPVAADRHKNRLNTLVKRVELPRGLPPLRPARLRTTWMVTLLNANVPVYEVLAAAGLVSTKSLEDLVPHLVPLPTEKALRTLADALT